MTDLAVEDQFAPTPPIRNESARNYINSYSTNSTNSSALSTSISLASTNTSFSQGSYQNGASHHHHHHHNNHHHHNGVPATQQHLNGSSSSGLVVLDKPLPKTPDEDTESKKKSKLKQTKG